MEGLLFRRFTWRHWRRSWQGTCLLVLILGLGVGVFLSIRLANRAAVTGFSLFTDSLTGESDLILRPRDGQTLPESVPGALRQRLGALPVAMFPVVEATVAEGGGGTDPFNARPLQLIGADLVALRNAVYLQPEPGRGKPVIAGTEEEFRLADPGKVFVTASYAARRGLAPGAPLAVFVNDSLRTLTVAGVLRSDPLRAELPENLLLMDLPGAQRLLGHSGRISRLELRVPPGAEAARNREAVRQLLGRPGEEDGWAAETPEDRRETAAAMTSAFRLNLTILSTLALLVGTYLILQALEAAVVRRRPEIAILRSLGVGPAQIRRAWLVESCALGLAGSLLGILLGTAAAQGAVGTIARTVNSLYYQTTTRAASFDWVEALLATGFGVAASLVAGWLPARDAAETPPAQSLKQGARSAGPGFLSRWRLGVVLLVVAGGLSLLPPAGVADQAKVPAGGYAAALAALLGLGMLTGPLFRWTAALLGRFRERPVLVWAGSQLRRPTGRHRLAAAGLVAAVGMAAGMSILVASFEATLTGWMNQALAADLVIATPGAGNASNTNTIRAATWQDIARQPGVQSIDLFRRYPHRFRGHPIRLAGFQQGYRSEGAASGAGAPRPASAAGSRSAATVVPAMVNEPFSRRFGVRKGDRFPLEVPGGTAVLEVRAVYADYSDHQGTIQVEREVTAGWFADAAVTSLGISVEPGADPEQLKVRLAGRYPALVVRTNRHLREEALRVFHRTFAVTHALEGIGVAVALAGLGLTVASLLLERRPEILTLQSLGVTRRQIARACAVEGVSLALIGTVGGLLLSLILGLLLVYVINRQSFGWTLSFRVPVVALGGLALATLGTSALVAAAVGRWGAKLRSEPVE